MQQPDLTAPFRIANLELRNRVLLAPLAGIGNWFVRLQARRYGAGMAVSEMVSGHALHHRNRRTLDELLRIDPREGPVAIQLFGSDPEVMRSGAAVAAEAGPDLIDINLGCPVPKVRRTGAGAALLADPGRAVAIARAAGEGSGLPVTVKLRSGLEPGDRSGVDLALRLAADAGVAAIAFHPRSARVQHQGKPDYALARELVDGLRRRGLTTPVIISGGLRSVDAVHLAYAASNADAVMIARGALGNPWIFSLLTGERTADPQPREIVAELRWVIGRAVEHWGRERATRNLRKLYPWYLERLGIRGGEAHAFQRVDSLDRVRAMLESVAATREIPARTQRPAAIRAVAAPAL
jgi:tRNA-dihydrouridine synthase B